MSRFTFGIAGLAVLICLTILPTSVAGSSGECGPTTAMAPGLTELTPGPALTATVHSGSGWQPPPPRVVVDRVSNAEDWPIVDSVTDHALVPAGERYAVKLSQKTKRLSVVPLPSNLSATAASAVSRAPAWLQDELGDNLRRMFPEQQDTFGELILQAEDPTVDEIAFQVARIAPESLTHDLFTPELIVENAELIYEHAVDLQYVRLVDSGSCAEGGDYYTTTEYRVLSDGQEKWVQIPREMYYWFVVHPKLSDETVKKSSEHSDKQATYGFFWRHYLYSNPDPVHDYTIGPGGEQNAFPLLSDVLKRPTVLWDYESGNLPKGRPFTDEDVALDVIGNWVSKILPVKARGNRPVQPNQIAFEHDGNCGELQDLLGAAARTALIPVSLIADHCEDHVWNEFYMVNGEQEWYPYQVSWDGGPTHINNPRIAMDRDHGGGKDISAVWAWRGDGYIFDVVERYSKSSTLVIHAKDGYGMPIDGAQVLLASEKWNSTDLRGVSWCYTRSDGTCSFEVGDHQNYYVRVSSSLGNFPRESGKVARVVEDAEADKTYEATATLSGLLKWHRYLTEPVEEGPYELRVRFNVPNEIVYSRSLVGEQPEAAVWTDAGKLDVLVVDATNLALLDAGKQFTALAGERDVSSGEMVFVLPDPTTDYYLMLSNEDHLVNAQVLDVEVTLHRDPSLPAEPPQGIYLPLALNDYAFEQTIVPEPEPEL